MNSQLTSSHIMLRITAIVFSLVAFATAAHADIFRWEYINPADPSQGKRQSTTLAPHGAGVDAVPGAPLYGRNLTMAYLIGADLTGANGFQANLTSADLSQANLTNASFLGAKLTDADLTGAQVRGATFWRDPRSFGGTGITLVQLYSTASYQARDLTGIGLGRHNLSGANFAGHNLTNASFGLGYLIGANFSEANLTNASFSGATISDADFTDAEIRGADFSKVQFGCLLICAPPLGGITGDQLYSTASYKAQDLSGIRFERNDLTAGNFAGQNLTNASVVGATLTNADFSHANLTNANLDSAGLTNTLLSGAILTGAQVQYTNFEESNLTSAQLFSTASYVNGNLEGIRLSIIDLSGADFAGMNLNRASLSSANLSGTDFTGANVESAQFNRSDLTLAQLYSTASYVNGNLNGIGLANTDLAGADFANKYLSSADFSSANLGGTDFTGADVQGANFDGAGLTLAQFYSTASYVNGNLIGINLANTDLSGADFANKHFLYANFSSANLNGASLANASFDIAILTNANLTGADVRGASFTPDLEGYSPAAVGITLAQLYSTSSYRTQDLTGIHLAWNNLAGANFAGQNLTNASFHGATLTGANFSGANLTNASFYGATLTDADFIDAHVQGASLHYAAAADHGFTATQLYSTASYQARILTGIDLGSNDLRGWNFASQNLTNARFDSATLTGGNFSGANLANAGFTAATLTDADFTAADARGAYSLEVPASAIAANLIRADGHINGLDLNGGGLLVVRDDDIGSRFYPDAPPIPITVDEHLAMGPGGTLRMVFESDEWDSTISFASGIPVTLGGTLELTFAADVNLASQLGRTFDLFNWSGVNPTGMFAISSPYRWDLSNLYATGEVTLTSVPESACLTLAAVALVVIMPRRGHRSRALMNRAACRWTKIVALTLAVALQQTTSHAATVRTVALSGQPAPGTPAGVNYSSFGAHFLTAIARQTYRGPVINNAGQVAFRANLTGNGIDATNNQGVWSEGAGSLAMVARTGDVAPGMPDGVNFGLNHALELFEPVLNNAGQTAFYGGLTDGTVGLWSQGSGNLALVARDGTPAPGTADGVNLSFAVLRDFFPGLPKLNDAGHVAFLANVTGVGVDNTNDWGVWSQSTGGLGLVARSGSPAPGTPDGVNFDSFFFQSGFNNAGQSAFLAFVTGDGVDPSNDQGIWSEGPGGLTLVARSGSPAPGTPSGVNFRDFIFATVAFNNMGQTSFKGFLAGEGVDDSNDEGIWSESSGTLALVARRGSPAPGTPSGVNFDEFAVRPALSDAGQSAFSATLTGTGVTSANNQGIWLGDDENLTLVARTGNQAPGAPAGVQFSNLGRQTVNSAGQIAFRAGLTGTGVGAANNLGIWATDHDGALQLIARTGSQLEIAPGVFRTTSDLGIALDSGNSDGRASAFNDLGQLVFWASFTNGTQGVFVSSAVAHLSGDFNNDGTVDAADYVVWRTNDGTQTGYDTWRANFGRTLFTGSGATIHLAPGESPGANYAVPEPVNAELAAIGLAALILRRRRIARAVFGASSLVGRQQTMAITLAAVAVLWHAPIHAAHGAAIALAAGTTSSEFGLDSEGSFEAQNAYVSGRVPTNVKSPIRGGTNINTLLGADAFYEQGFTGNNAVVASIEAGHIWSGHETLSHVLQIPNHPSALNEFDRHHTWVGAMIGGRQGGASPGAYQEGMAPDAQLYSGAVASQWNGPRFTQSFNFANETVYDQYRKAFSTGVNMAGRRADVINSSWGSDESQTGTDTLSIALDGFANANSRTLFVVSAGNDGPGPDTVFSPASAYNNMSVAALGPNPPYDRPASFSSGGPNDYADPVNGTKNNARQAVDIAAPGENLSAAYYGGEAGGNGSTDNLSESGPGPTGLPAGPLGGPNFYSRGGLSGTSFASPTVAGGAALLYDAAYSVFSSNDDACDARVMKAVLMNSADKTFGWNNTQASHPSGNGGVLTTQGLDNRVGTGRLNLTAAFDQFLTGTTDIAGTASGNLGLVNDVGWDFGQVVSGTTNDYYFDSPLTDGSTFTATLTWFRDRRTNASNTVFDDSFDDLNLELWSVVDGIPTSLISESSSLYNESEHFSFELPVTGEYALRVRWFKEVFDVVGDANQELYSLAWRTGAGFTALTIPEPASAALLVVAVAAFGASRHARRFR